MSIITTKSGLLVGPVFDSNTYKNKFYIESELLPVDYVGNEELWNELSAVIALAVESALRGEQ